MILKLTAIKEFYNNYAYQNVQIVFKIYSVKRVIKIDYKLF